VVRFAVEKKCEVKQKCAVETGKRFWPFRVRLAASVAARPRIAAQKVAMCRFSERAIAERGPRPDPLGVNVSLQSNCLTGLISTSLFPITVMKEIPWPEFPS
jgi:hypothetical protein